MQGRCRDRKTGGKGKREQEGNVERSSQWNTGATSTGSVLSEEEMKGREDEEGNRGEK